MPQRIVAPSGRPVYVESVGSPQQTVIYIHGYYVTTDEAVEKYKLFDQLKASGVNATYIVPSAPQSNEEPVYFPTLDALLSLVASAGYSLSGPVVVIAHSGGFRTVLKWLSSPRVKAVALLDALYASAVTPITNWVRAGGRLLLIAAPSTGAAMATLASKVPSVEFIQSGASHMALVTSGNWIPDAVRRLALTGKNIWPYLLVGAVVAVAIWSFA